jgi:hypothetical protein
VAEELIPLRTSCEKPHRKNVRIYSSNAVYIRIDIASSMKVAISVHVSHIKAPLYLVEGGAGVTVGFISMLWQEAFQETTNQP